VRPFDGRARSSTLLAQHHYLGYQQPVGETLKYSSSRPIARSPAWPGRPRRAISARAIRFIGGQAARRGRRNIRASRTHALSDSAVGHGPALGVAHPRGAWRPCAADWQRLYGTRCIFSNFHRPRAISRHVLSRRQLDYVGRTTGRGKNALTKRPTRSIKRSSAIHCCRNFASAQRRLHDVRRPRIDVTMQDLHALLEQLHPRLSDQEYEQLTAVIDTLGYVAELLDDQTTTLARLPRLLLDARHGENPRCAGACRSRDDHQPPSDADPSSSAPDHSPRGASPRAWAPWRGRLCRRASGPRRVHRQLTRATAVPTASRANCTDSWSRRGSCGSSPCPLAATVYELEKLRCNPVAKSLRPNPPAGRRSRQVRRDHRGDGRSPEVRQRSAILPARTTASERRIPLPASTQWENRGPHGPADRAGTGRADPSGRRTATCCTTTTRA